MIDLDELKRLHDAATNAPWRTDTVANAGKNWLIGTGSDDTADWIVTTDEIRGSQLTGGGAREDAELITYLRNAVPDIIALLERERR